LSKVSGILAASGEKNDRSGRGSWQIASARPNEPHRTSLIKEGWSKGNMKKAAQSRGSRSSWRRPRLKNKEQIAGRNVKNTLVNRFPLMTTMMFE
jgi:hypothetical protein